MREGRGGEEGRKRLQTNPRILKNPFARDWLGSSHILTYVVLRSTEPNMVEGKTRSKEALTRL